MTALKKIRKKLSRENWGYFFIAPFFLIFLVFQLYPMFYTVNLSFTDLSGWSDNFSYNGFANYAIILQDKFFWKAVANTFIIWGMNFAPQIIFAFLFAVLFSNIRLKIRGRKFFKLIYFMPSIITAASVSVLFYNFFNYPSGPFYLIFRNMGLLPEGFNFYLNQGSSRILVSFMQFWMWFGNTMVILTAGILGINPSVNEAATIDGASNTKIFWKITLPLIKPILLYTLVTSLVGGLQIFDIPYLFLGGGPDYATTTLAVYIYKFAFVNPNAYYNLAAAASVLLLIIASALSGIMYKSFYGKKEA